LIFADGSLSIKISAAEIVHKSQLAQDLSLSCDVHFFIRPHFSFGLLKARWIREEMIAAYLGVYINFTRSAKISKSLFVQILENIENKKLLHFTAVLIGIIIRDKKRDPIAFRFYSSPLHNIGFMNLIINGLPPLLSCASRRQDL